MSIPGSIVAGAWSTGGHMGGGWWIVMMFGMVLFWAAVIVGIAWLARGGSFAGPRYDAPPGGGRETPLEILDRRFAEGAISAEDYRARREVITGGTAQR
jgi:putative membrane protein